MRNLKTRTQELIRDRQTTGKSQSHQTCQDKDTVKYYQLVGLSGDTRWDVIAQVAPLPFVQGSAALVQIDDETLGCPIHYHTHLKANTQNKTEIFSRDMVNPSHLR